MALSEGCLGKHGNARARKECRQIAEKAHTVLGHFVVPNSDDFLTKIVFSLRTLKFTRFTAGGVQLPSRTSFLGE